MIATGLSVDRDHTQHMQHESVHVQK